MPKLLTPIEQTVLQQDTDYLNAGIDIMQSRVVLWMNRYVLIYHTLTQGYIATDITDLGSTTIQALAQQSEVHGMWYYLPTSITEVVSEEAETAVDIAKKVGATTEQIATSVAAAIGQTLANLLQPVVGALMVPLVIVGVLLALYLFKKG